LSKCSGGNVEVKTKEDNQNKNGKFLRKK